jgi:hypothetical protein
MKFSYGTQFGKEHVRADLGTEHEYPFIEIENAVGNKTQIYCHDIPKLLANIMLANEYIKENKQ